ncbi:MAG TPA: NAD(P)/FAD-dependent oxidoreductase [Pirellulales bacterium]|nr:NAD(P)/FAD-dependent oxidoreductase [Pirellulales bacterium]
MSSIDLVETDPTAEARPAHTRVAIVGAGFSGIGAAIALQREGIEFVIFERRGDYGGTWLDNTYPGCKCDVPSHLYSFSFAPNPNWTTTFSSQREIQEYLRNVVRRFDVARHIRFRHDLLGAEWDETARVWRIATSGGSWTADFLISACGALSEPAWPRFEGMDSFRGTAFHSAAWDETYDLTGKRVAVIGTGASAIQFVPKIQPAVQQLYLFQRTPAWILPHPEKPISAGRRAFYRRFPLAQRLIRWAIYWSDELLALIFTRYPRHAAWIKRHALRHLERQVTDPALREKLTPDYEPGCKRLLLSNDFYPAIAADNVELVTEPIARVGAHSLFTADGREREIDAMILGTGFRVTDNPLAERVRGSQGMSLADVWREGAYSHRGTTVPGFPNLFLMTGPNTGIGHTSLLVMIEAQLAYVTACLRWMEGRWATFDVRPESCRAFNADLEQRMQRTIWMTGGCRSWYLDAQGRNTTLWPDFTWRYRRLMRRFDAANYSFAGATKKPAATV